MYKYSVFAGLIIITLWCGCTKEPLQESETQLEPELCNTACEAPDGYNCWYVSTRGSDTNSGTCDEPFKTVQYAVDTMNGGDYIYLRSGTYFENVFIPYSGTEKDGSCSGPACTDGSWSTIKSYPGEWAVIDGQNNADYTIGYHRTGSDGTNDLMYWKFERLEITGGTLGSAADTGGGISVNGGPFIVRYCYIHDNEAYSCSENPGGIWGYAWHDSVIEYNWFRDNGGEGQDEPNNCSHIVIFSDYKEFNLWDSSRISYSTNKNIFRYNLFEGNINGIKHKNEQKLSDRFSSGSDVEFKEYGDKIHHNIFTGLSGKGIRSNQDFVQIYNNIVDGGDGISTAELHRAPLIVYSSVYNNLVIGGQIRGDDAKCDGDSNEDCDTMTVYDLTPYWIVLNNIIEGSSSDDCCSMGSNSGRGIITIGSEMAYGGSDGDGTLSLIGSLISHNLINNAVGNDAGDYRIGRFVSGDCDDWMNTESYNSCYGSSNYASDASGLFQGSIGASKYIARGDHEIESGTTIANGGIGGVHPYLLGVTIPDYIGAANPEDNDWVAGVLGLADTNVLKDSSTDIPDWVEGE